MVKLRETGSLFKITKMKSQTMNPRNLNEIYIQGYQVDELDKPVFTYPCSSKISGIVQIGQEYEELK